jgi:hypothetical protein
MGTVSFSLSLSKVPICWKFFTETYLPLLVYTDAWRFGGGADLRLKEMKELKSEEQIVSWLMELGQNI